MAGNGPLLAQTREAADRLGVRTTWCGFLNQGAMPRALAAADCVALPSQSETWGLIVNEALAVGTPCVVSDRVGCAPDLIRDDIVQPPSILVLRPPLRPARRSGGHYGLLRRAGHFPREPDHL
jgi:glycosyltransferase involved in cell wall biosynthesis